MKVYRGWGPAYEEGVRFIDPETNKKMNWSQRENFASERVLAFFVKQAQLWLSRYPTSTEEDYALLKEHRDGLLKYVISFRLLSFRGKVLENAMV